MEIVKHTYKPAKKLVSRRLDKLSKIILHCAATVEGVDYTVEDIDRWHKKESFAMIGYNYVIYRDGSVHEARPVQYVPAHTSGHNTESLGICYIGGVDKNKKAKDTRTKAQKESMYQLVEFLMNEYNLDLSDVHCHNEYANKACPSFKIDKFRNEYKKWKASNEPEKD